MATLTETLESAIESYKSAKQKMPMAAFLEAQLRQSGLVTQGTTIVLGGGLTREIRVNADGVYGSLTLVGRATSSSKNGDGVELLILPLADAVTRKRPGPTRRNDEET